MGTEALFIAVLLLAGLAVFDLVVGVANDAVNFLNSSIGSRVAPRHVIMIVASVGLLAGVSFSSGMMEVARKGIFQPQLFTMPELMTIFLAVMISDIVLLDVFNCFGMPTSTTVSIVFNLLGAAVGLSAWKIMEAGGGIGELSAYINTSKALAIIGGILLSVIVAFALGALAQVASRLLFTFDYQSRMRRYGALWGGVALASITYFILVKGAKGAVFISPDTRAWITGNAALVLGIMFGVSALALQGLLLLGVNIFKPIVMVGTFALALAFAANDLVNFIGVPMAGYHAWRLAMETTEPLTTSMQGLNEAVPSELGLLMLAGGIMVVTLWVSRRARSVADTEINLSHHGERAERFESSMMARAIVRLFVTVGRGVEGLMPRTSRVAFSRRLARPVLSDAERRKLPPFDLLRASVNLMAASAVISYATSYKLPLSTTYVTFMVAMGTSFADMAWGRDSAVYRVSGVISVIGGWFLTALAAFVVSGVFASVLYLGGGLGLAGLVILGAFLIQQNHRTFARRQQELAGEETFADLDDHDLEPRHAVSKTFSHMGRLVHEVRLSLATVVPALRDADVQALALERARSRKVQRWTDAVNAVVFRTVTRLDEGEDGFLARYAKTVRRLQKLADGQHDIVGRAFNHVRNHHTGPAGDQLDDMEQVVDLLCEILERTERAFVEGDHSAVAVIAEQDRRLRLLVEQADLRQAARIRAGRCKPRVTVLFYALTGNARMLSKSNAYLLSSFLETDPRPQESRPPQPVFGYDDELAMEAV